MGFISIKATVVYWCSKVINRLRENKSGLQTKSEGNTSSLKGKKTGTIGTPKCNKNKR